MTIFLLLLWITLSTAESTDEICEEFKEFHYKPITSLQDIELHHVAWFTAAIFTIAAIAMTSKLIKEHISFYYKPQYQRHIIRILLMVPIYAICSFLSLIFFQKSVYFDVTKNCYEAFVIYEFFMLLLNYLGNEEETQLLTMTGKPVMHYPFPFGCYKFDPTKPSFFLLCKRMTLQYVVIHPLTTLAAVILEYTGTLCPDSMSYKHGMFWVTFIEFISVSVAMYGLVLFYVVVSDDLRPFQPIPKFLAVKFVIFFSFWQSVLLSMAVSFGFIKETEWYTTTNLVTSMQSYLICFEMLLAALMHNKAFGAESFIPASKVKMPFYIGLKDALAIKDYVEEIQDVVKTNNEGGRFDFLSVKKAPILHDESEEDVPYQKHSRALSGDKVDHKKKKFNIKSKYNKLETDEIKALTIDEQIKMEKVVTEKTTKFSKYVSLKNSNEDDEDDLKDMNIKREQSEDQGHNISYSFVPTTDDIQ
ncbi:Organic solute transporter Ost-alpha domain-containing protein [Rozella allomycis CSF55]|uniref:Organic solute transporter Ost-alpha domain-containing protein n=1 Tax=Rozella allomycis (strain CSF55) TaxID=988480 RepID=A0A075ARY7_ROZAC|nr:Organic solute transporter Ost-alpha domain-containing protein [Rozella allomycis CSF55]|eukprot:EPZ32940.1 Organic solute transporter Ost-alpha domain-containing protein [Rozella allomycis CSF55]